MTTTDYLESLQDDLSRTVEALNLEEGTNFTDIADMAENGEISTGGGADLSEYFNSEIKFNSVTGIVEIVKKLPDTLTFTGTNATKLFSGYKGINIPMMDFSQCDNMSDCFANCINITSIPLLNTQNVTSFYECFTGCNKLTTIPLLNTSSATNFNSMFSGCGALLSIPLIDTSNATSMNNMFQNCYELTTIPLLNTSKVTTMSYLISSSTKLTDTSLDNILQMCANVSSNYVATKQFSSLGNSQTRTAYPATRLQALPHYQDFIDAGWSIGYN